MGSFCEGDGYGVGGQYHIGGNRGVERGKRGKVEELEERNSGTVEQWNGGTVEQWNGGTVERWNSKKIAERVWRRGRYYGEV
jgi:hypothetical protein